MSKIVGLLLAAGSSTRFGSDKLLYPLENGEAIIRASAKKLLSATDQTLVLIRPNQSILYQALQGLHLELIEVSHASEGMGATLAYGIGALQNATACVIALGDMPFVQMGTLQSVVHALEHGASIAAPYYHGKRGHPVGFSRCWFSHLSALKGDSGAKTLLQDQAERIVQIKVDDRGCLLDIDTPADIQAAYPVSIELLNQLN